MNNSNKVRDEEEIETLLKNSKQCFSKEEYSRRLEWIVLTCEEKLNDELAREKTIYSLISSLLVATSFLSTAFATYLISYLAANHQRTPLNAAFTIAAGVLLIFSIGFALYTLIYRKQKRLVSVLETSCTYLSQNTSFGNDYSENYGRILLLNDYIQTREKNNSHLAKCETINVIFITLFLVTFSLCFFFFN